MGLIGSLSCALQLTFGGPVMRFWAVWLEVPLWSQLPEHPEVNLEWKRTLVFLTSAIVFLSE